MNPTRIGIVYACAALVFLVLDAAWLSTMAERLYRPAIGHLMARGVSWAPAVLFYLLYVAGMLAFVVLPAVDAGQPARAWLWGAFLGLLAYGTYDLTNQATLQGWPWRVTLADLAWGAFATGTACGVSALVLGWWDGR